MATTHTRQPPPVASRVRAWVDAAPPGAVLDARSAPDAPSNATRVALSHLAAEPFPLIMFVRRHIYWKHESRPDAEGGVGHTADYLQVARHLAAAGGGYAGWTAGWTCGWTRHDPHNFDIAVVGRPPRRFAADIYFCSRGNDARRALAWDEVTLMEAVLGFVRTDGFDVLYRPGHDWMCDYDQSHDEAECLWGWPDPLIQFTDRILSHPDKVGRYRPGRLLRAVRSETGSGRDFADKMADVADAIAQSQRAAT